MNVLVYLLLIWWQSFPSVSCSQYEVPSTWTYYRFLKNCIIFKGLLLEKRKHKTVLTWYTCWFIGSVLPCKCCSLLCFCNASVISLSFCLCLQLLFTIFCLAYVMWCFILLSLRFNFCQQALQNNFWFDTTSDSSLNSESRCCGLIFVAANDDAEEFVLLHLNFPCEDGFIAVLCFLSISDFSWLSQPI